MKVKHRYFLQYGCRESEVTLAEYLYAQATALNQPVSTAVAFSVPGGASGRIKTEIEE